MNIIDIVIISFSLSMDAFAVSICKGLTLKKNYIKAIIIALYFGIFQAIMPLIGYFFSTKIKAVDSIDHYIILLLLSIIGIGMIFESTNEEAIDDKIDFKTMIMLAIATSIDAFAAGITFGVAKVDIFISILIIGIITFIVSFIGVIIGNKIGNKLGEIAKLVGGIFLILMGIRIFFLHM